MSKTKAMLLLLKLRSWPLDNASVKLKSLSTEALFIGVDYGVRN